MCAEGNARVAVIVPCKDEEATIGAVIDGFKAALPAAQVYVIDNNCVDATVRIAAQHGATVLRETRAGKGHAVRKAFREVEASIYLLVDGDDTYPAHDAARMIEPVASEMADVVVGVRLGSESRSEFHWVNRLGNRLLLGTVNFVFGARLTDLLSGYRAMSRDYVKQAPILSGGFELETELSILALERGFRTVEIPVDLRSRPAGSQSKVKILGDGFRILRTILGLFRDYRPLSFFGSAGLMCMMLGLAPGLFVTYEFSQYGTVRIPTAVLATGLEIAGLTLILAGVILTAISRRFRELDHRLDLLADQMRQER